MQVLVVRTLSNNVKSHKGLFFSCEFFLIFKFPYHILHFTITLLFIMSSLSCVLYMGTDSDTEGNLFPRMT